MMPKRPTAREREARAAAEPPPQRGGSAPSNEPQAMLARRGFQATPGPIDLPFLADLDGVAAERVSEKLGHYAFRLFLRGAIQKPGGFLPGQATRYLNAAQARGHADSLVDLGLAARLAGGRYRLLRPAKSFGGTLEWYVARELRRRFGFAVSAGLHFRARGVGGDLDVVAAAEGKLLYLELKSSPPKHLSSAEVAAFFDRLESLRPDLALFVMDTALRLEDRVLPMLAAEMARRRAASSPRPRRIIREVWALTPHLYAVNARLDLLANIGRAIAEGLRALAPPPP